MEQETFDCDVLVVGTGASGMSTAVTAASQGLKVLVVEKEPRFGGTTARSGGWLWIPGTRLATEQGIHEPAGAAREYLKHEATTHFDAARVDAFLENGPKAVDFFTRKTACSSTCRPCFPTTTPRPSAASRAGARWSRGPSTAASSGKRIKHLAPPLPELTVFGMMLGSGKEIKHFMRAFRSVESFVYVTKRLSLHVLDVLRHGRGMTLTNGNALAGRLAKAGHGPEHPGLAVVAGARSSSSSTTASPAPSSSATASGFASTPSAASCSPAAASRTTWSGASSCSLMRPPERSTSRLRRKPTPVTACAWPSRWADGSTGRSPTPRPGCRPR